MPTIYCAPYENLPESSVLFDSHYDTLLRFKNQFIHRTKDIGLNSEQLYKDRRTGITIYSLRENKKERLIVAAVPVAKDLVITPIYALLTHDYHETKKWCRPEWMRTMQVLFGRGIVLPETTQAGLEFEVPTVHYEEGSPSAVSAIRRKFGGWYDTTSHALSAASDARRYVLYGPPGCGKSSAAFEALEQAVKHAKGGAYPQKIRFLVHQERSIRHELLLREVRSEWEKSPHYRADNSDVFIGTYEAFIRNQFASVRTLPAAGYAEFSHWFATYHKNQQQRMKGMNKGKGKKAQQQDTLTPSDAERIYWELGIIAGYESPEHYKSQGGETYYVKPADRDFVLKVYQEYTKQLQGKELDATLFSAPKLKSVVLLNMPAKASIQDAIKVLNGRNGLVVFTPLQEQTCVFVDEHGTAQHFSIPTYLERLCTNMTNLKCRDTRRFADAEEEHLIRKLIGCPEIDVLIVDEVQRMNFGQLRQLNQSLAPDARLAFFGDYLQGKSAFSQGPYFHQFKLEVVESPPVSYRCPVNVVDVTRQTETWRSILGNGWIGGHYKPIQSAPDKLDVLGHVAKIPILPPTDCKDDRIALIRAQIEKQCPELLAIAAQERPDFAVIIRASEAQSLHLLREEAKAVFQCTVVLSIEEAQGGQFRNVVFYAMNPDTLELEASKKIRANHGLEVTFNNPKNHPDIRFMPLMAEFRILMTRSEQNVIVVGAPHGLLMQHMQVPQAQDPLDLTGDYEPTEAEVHQLIKQLIVKVDSATALAYFLKKFPGETEAEFHALFKEELCCDVGEAQKEPVAVCNSDGAGPSGIKKEGAKAAIKPILVHQGNTKCKKYRQELLKLFGSEKPDKVLADKIGTFPYDDLEAIFLEPLVENGPPMLQQLLIQDYDKVQNVLELLTGRNKEKSMAMAMSQINTPLLQRCLIMELMSGFSVEQLSRLRKYGYQNIGALLFESAWTSDAPLICIAETKEDVVLHNCNRLLYIRNTQSMYIYDMDTKRYYDIAMDPCAVHQEVAAWYATVNLPAGKHYAVIKCDAIPSYVYAQILEMLMDYLPHVFYHNVLNEIMSRPRECNVLLDFIETLKPLERNALGLTLHAFMAPSARGAHRTAFKEFCIGVHASDNAAVFERFYSLFRDDLSLMSPDCFYEGDNGDANDAGFTPFALLAITQGTASVLCALVRDTLKNMPHFPLDVLLRPLLSSVGISPFISLSGDPDKIGILRILMEDCIAHSSNRAETLEKLIQELCREALIDEDGVQAPYVEGTALSQLAQHPEGRALVLWLSEQKDVWIPVSAMTPCIKPYHKRSAGEKVLIGMSALFGFCKEAVDMQRLFQNQKHLLRYIPFSAWVVPVYNERTRVAGDTPFNRALQSLEGCKVLYEVLGTALKSQALISNKAVLAVLKHSVPGDEVLMPWMKLFLEEMQPVGAQIAGMLLKAYPEWLEDNHILYGLFTAHAGQELFLELAHAAPDVLSYLTVDVLQEQICINQCAMDCTCSATALDVFFDAPIGKGSHLERIMQVLLLKSTLEEYMLMCLCESPSSISDTVQQEVFALAMRYPKAINVLACSEQGLKLIDVFWKQNRAYATACLSRSYSGWHLLCTYAQPEADAKDWIEACMTKGELLSSFDGEDPNQCGLSWLTEHTDEGVFIPERIALLEQIFTLKPKICVGSAFFEGWCISNAEVLQRMQEHIPAVHALFMQQNKAHWVHAVPSAERFKFFVGGAGEEEKGAVSPEHPGNKGVSP